MSRHPTTYIAIARNVTDGDDDLYAVLDWTVEAHSKQEAERIVRERHGFHLGFALVPSRYFSEFKPAPTVDTKEEA